MTWCDVAWCVAFNVNFERMFYTWRELLMYHNGILCACLFLLLWHARVDMLYARWCFVCLSAANQYSRSEMVLVYTILMAGIIDSSRCFGFHHWLLECSAVLDGVGLTYFMHNILAIDWSNLVRLRPPHCLFKLRDVDEQILSAIEVS